MGKKFLGFSLVFACLLSGPTASHAQWSGWYGWDNYCSPDLLGDTPMCASVQIRTAPTGDGGTSVDARFMNLSPVSWSGEMGMMFSPSLPVVPDGQGGFHPFVQWDGGFFGGWGGRGAWAVMDIGGARYGGGWAYLNFLAAFPMREYDLVGYTAEVRRLSDPYSIMRGLNLRNPTYVPEPSTVILLATGLLGIGLVAWRRKEEKD